MASSTQEINGVEINKKIDYYIVYLAKYAVQVHNQQQNAHLSFIKVVKATIEPVVEGVVYYVTLEACNLGVEQQLYEAKVWVKESTDYIELQNFQHVVEVLKDGEITKKVDLITEGINDAKISKISTDSTVIDHFANSSAQEIKDVEIQEKICYYIVDLANYALQMHNQQQNDHLTSCLVLKATIQTELEGVLNYITLMAINEEQKDMVTEEEAIYEAKVWVKESPDYIELQDFLHLVELYDETTNKEKADLLLVRIAKFAVKEYNREENADLVFVKVMDGRRTEPVHHGELHYITFEASSIGVVGSYEAMVLIKGSSVWPLLELVDFKPLLHSIPTDK